MKKTAQKNRLLISTSFAMSVLLSACGGGDLPLNSASAAAPAQTRAAAQRSPAYHSSAMAAVPPPRDELKEGFNPSIWNEHKWYECNCSRNPDASAPSTTPWAFSS